MKTLKLLSEMYAITGCTELGDNLKYITQKSQRVKEFFVNFLSIKWLVIQQN